MPSSPLFEVYRSPLCDAWERDTTQLTARMLAQPHKRDANATPRLRFAHGLGRWSIVLTLVKELMCLCSEVHRRIYVP